MNEKVMIALRKIISDENLQEEIFGSYNQSIDRLFELCLKYSDEDFTKEEFKFVLSELFVLAFENSGNLSNISEFDLQNVAGGTNLKKVIAIPLVAFSLMGKVPTRFAPKADALILNNIARFWGHFDKQENISWSKFCFVYSFDL
ncbi:MAG: hypothetical protein LBK29_00445 [Oscillospiraceae bacterium]|jgi:hypothetical protein|nr:hypothetical protein [Oscillospiraceae bacterium]